MRIRAFTIWGVSLSIGAMAAAQSNIHPDHPNAWQENVGWTNWRDANGAQQGVRVGTSVLSGFIWSENVGWINVGDGTPGDGTHYANTDGSDAGVNVDPDTGDLSGLAWGENVGWVNFDTAALGAQRARFDFCAAIPRFRGFAWAENVGWVNLDDATHYVGSTVDNCGGGGGCNGSEVLRKATCRVRGGLVDKLVVLVVNATPGQEYTATLDTGQTRTAIASTRAKAKFVFKGANAPGCGANGVSVCTLHKNFTCGC